ncbi:extracellular catalytic domain type 1 short-chain-length polyhydroxyalkanoate depolymerase [Saccharothrix luteola]|uniref:extracellular catalytic domain type 1 short-chain-length polyhydroxyalkanoate depolymerase n=1 Tax=Saccharothrix luteola TaxID=2893018 RepID=UPI001E587DF5|nr:PHB depolymerase family esterase [Saccharothrix luteola]MCC8243986.1 PHB depolymerase family esterase [Saccharothrix luteola]
MKVLGAILGSLAVAAAFVLASVAAPQASAATLTEVTGFGTNPSNLRMHLYVPDRTQARPGVLLAVHYCTGTGPAFHSGTDFARLADQYGFIVIYPSATRSGQCFDVSSQQALRRDGGSDPVGLMSMVRYVLQRYNGDTSRVFVTGVSSGAMTTNVMLANYPDVFAAGAAFAGVPASCFATTDGSGWNSACANGQVNKTPQEWGNLVRGAYPGYSGARPRMQLWHGTNDDTLRYPNFTEEIEQWTNVHGLSTTPTSTDYPQSSWTRTRYGDKVEAISIQGGSHNVLVSGMALRAIQFFGLDQTGPTTTDLTNSTTTTVPDPTGACRVTYAVSSWNTGLTASISITNTGTSPVNGWQLAFTLPSGQTITSGWSATYSPTSGAVTARNASYNGTLNPGASTGIGFQATHTGNTGEPTSFTLNGAACTVA